LGNFTSDHPINANGGSRFKKIVRFAATPAVVIPLAVHSLTASAGNIHRLTLLRVPANRANQFQVALEYPVPANTQRKR
jgi:hypothetical protein